MSDDANLFVSSQNNYIKSMISQKPNDVYWQLVNAIWQQLNGMYKGYSDRVTELGLSAQRLSFNQFYLLANQGDLEDIVPAFPKKGQREKSADCNTFVKLTSNDLFTTHSTFNHYSLMLRIYKVYNFAWNNPLIYHNKIQFSSRPGDLQSKDDFYIVNDWFVVTETSLMNQNPDNYKQLNANTIPTWMRVNIASRIAYNGEEWSNFFEINHSGTHNSQWLVVDYNKYRQ